MGNLPSGGSWRLVSSVDGLEAVDGAFVNAQTSREPIGWASLGQGVVLRRNTQPKRKDTCKPWLSSLQPPSKRQKGWTVTH